MTIHTQHQRTHKVAAFLPAEVHAWLVEQARRTGRPVMLLAEDIIVAEHARQTAPAIEPTENAPAGDKAA